MPSPSGLPLDDCVSWLCRVLDKLSHHKEDVDIIVTCTGANYAVITKEIYHQIVPKGKKVIIVDLAVPQDVEQEIIDLDTVDYIDIASLEIKAILSPLFTVNVTFLNNDVPSSVL